MKRNRIIVAVLVTILMVTGCAVSNNDTKKKTDEKVSVKKQDKSKSKKKRQKRKPKKQKKPRKKHRKNRKLRQVRLKRHQLLRGFRVCLQMRSCGILQVRI